ncbi:MAG: hypothetical protein HQK92_02965 [Nitrospirae bacterium]|nr:hypothetical protein [Nitrospirota bacterium]
MATPIKNTPLLSGKDARKFFQRAEESEKGLHKVSDSEYEKSKSIYEKVMEKNKRKI